MLEAVIFDMDGVMIDSEREHYAVEQKFFAELGISVNALEYDRFVGLSGRLMWTELQEKYSLPYKVEELLAKAAERLVLHFSGLALEPMPGLIDLLDHLNERSMLLAVASSSPLKLVELVVAKLGIGSYFDVLVSGDAVAAGKPYPDIFLHTASLLRVSPERCLVFEDSANGSRAAQKANMRCIGYQNAASGRQDLSSCQLIVTSFLGEDREKIEDYLWQA